MSLLYRAELQKTGIPYCASLSGFKYTLHDWYEDAVTGEWVSSGYSGHNTEASAISYARKAASCADVSTGSIKLLDKSKVVLV